MGLREALLDELKDLVDFDGGEMRGFTFGVKVELSSPVGQKLTQERRMRRRRGVSAQGAHF